MILCTPGTQPDVGGCPGTPLCSRFQGLCVLGENMVCTVRQIEWGPGEPLEGLSAFFYLFCCVYL
jgi:hypothetical protein